MRRYTYKCIHSDYVEQTFSHWLTARKILWVESWNYFLNHFMIRSIIMKNYTKQLKIIQWRSFCPFSHWYWGSWWGEAEHWAMTMRAIYSHYLFSPMCPLKQQFKCTLPFLLTMSKSLVLYDLIFTRLLIPLFF